LACARSERGCRWGLVRRHARADEFRLKSVSYCKGATWIIRAERFANTPAEGGGQ
jgi:hypothetical protein